jgi:membrane protein YqaA with SNARE-associated domain
MDENLSRFVREALGRGLAKDEIRRALLAARWPEDEVRGALDSFADVDFPLPVPRPRPYLSAREAFLYLVLFTLLYLSAWSFGALLFQFINRGLPDPAHPAVLGSFSASAVRWSIATLLIAFPGYLFLSRRSYAAARRDPEKRKSKVRKWLTYLTLFVAAGTLLGDLITLVYNLLEGELTARFLLKVLTIGAIAGSIFGYYLWDLRQDDLEPERIPARRPGLRLFASAVSLAVVVAIFGGLFLAGSPGRARMSQLDDHREQQLAMIAISIDRYWQEFDQLPPDLETLERTRGYAVRSRDPETRALYEYRITGERAYELCTEFDTASAAEDEAFYAPYGGSPDGSRFWDHGAGRTCFAIEVTGD